MPVGSAFCPVCGAPTGLPPGGRPSVYPPRPAYPHAPPPAAPFEPAAAARLRKALFVVMGGLIAASAVVLIHWALDATALSRLNDGNYEDSERIFKQLETYFALFPPILFAAFGVVAGGLVPIGTARTQSPAKGMAWAAFAGYVVITVINSLEHLLARFDRDNDLLGTLDGKAVRMFEMLAWVGAATMLALAIYYIARRATGNRGGLTALMIIAFVFTGIELLFTAYWVLGEAEMRWSMKHPWLFGFLMRGPRMVTHALLAFMAGLTAGALKQPRPRM